MLSSSNYSREEGVLNTGQVISPALTEKELKDPNLKIYYHQVKGAKTHMPDGAEIVFQGGMFATANEEIKFYLDKIADKRGSMVYTKSVAPILLEVAIAAEGASLPAGDASTVDTAPSAEMIQAVAQNQQSQSKTQLSGLKPGVVVKSA